MTFPTFSAAGLVGRSLGFSGWRQSRRWLALVLLVALASSLTADWPRAVSAANQHDRAAVLHVCSAGR